MVNQFKRFIALILVVAMMVTIMPFQWVVHAANASRVSDAIFIATDLHGYEDKLISLLKAVEYTPGLVALGADHVLYTNKGSLVQFSEDIHSVFPDAQTYYTYGDKHDINVTDDPSNPYAYARTGTVYEGKDYYVYALDMEEMTSVSRAQTSSAAFKTWAAKCDPRKVIIVLCHMPIHKRRGDNPAGYVWCNTLNDVANSHDVIYFWGHNHSGEDSVDLANYFVNKGGKITPEGGSETTIKFAYANAGYIRYDRASELIIDSDRVTITRYTTSGTVDSVHAVARDFNGTAHDYELKETVDPTCTKEGYRLYVCKDCGESYKEILPATGHTYSSSVTKEPTCTDAGVRTYVCKDCGDTYTEPVAALGHDFTSETVENCVGFTTTYTCKRCGYSYSETEEGGIKYEKANSLEEGASYVLVAGSSNVALTYSNSGAANTTVTVADGKITSDVTDAMVFTYSGRKLYTTVNGSKKYIQTGTMTAKKQYNIAFGSTGETVSYASSVLTVNKNKLYYSTSSRAWSLRNSGSNVTLYKMTGTAVAGSHDYVATVTVPATCEKEGLMTYTCSVCGDTYTEIIPAAGHKYTSAVTKEATCAAEGEKTYTCSVCGDHYSEPIPKTEHKYEKSVTAPTCVSEGYTTYTCVYCKDSYKADYTEKTAHNFNETVVKPTCTEGGYTEYVCVYCNYSYKGNETAAAGHDYKGTVTKEATCTGTGLMVYTCTRCGDHYEEILAIIPHDFESKVTAATCTDEGYTVYTCKECGYSYKGDVKKALGHDYKGETTAPTCTAEGYTVYTCTRCKDSYTGDIVKPAGHDYKATATEATCTEPGITKYVCAHCGDSYSTESPALGHDYVMKTVPATCTEDGAYVYTCSRCNDTYSEVIKAKGHQYEVTVREVTCTDDGYTLHTCKVCAYSYKDNVVTATGHDYKDTVIEPTCTLGGRTVHICSKCNDTYTSDEKDPLGHDYKGVVTEPTCNDGGYTTYTCARCHDSYVADKVPAKGHSYVDEVVPATCTEDGYTVHTCSACGDSFKDSVVKAAGHKYVAEREEPTCTKDGKVTYTCSVCGDSYSEVLKATGHKFTYEDIGNDRVYTCVNCGYSYTEHITRKYRYNKASSPVAGSSYVVTLFSSGNNYAVVHRDGGLALVKVNVSGNEVTSDVTAEMLWSYDSKGFYYMLDGEAKYLTVEGESAVRYSSNKLRIGNYYLYYENGQIMASRFSTGKASLFKATEITGETATKLRH